MAKKSESRTREVFKRFINIRYWADWDRVQQNVLYMINGIKRLFITKHYEQAESFDEVVKRLHLTEKDILARQKGLLRLSIIMLVLALFIFGYGIYHLVLASFLAFIVSIVVSFVAMTLAFRYHFWYYQMKEHKLGCTVNEWFKNGLLGGMRK